MACTSGILMEGKNISTLPVDLLPRLLESLGHFEYVEALVLMPRIIVPKMMFNLPSIFYFPYRLSQAVRAKMMARGPFPCRQFD